MTICRFCNTATDNTAGRDYMTGLPLYACAESQACLDRTDALRLAEHEARRQMDLRGYELLGIRPVEGGWVIAAQRISDSEYATWILTMDSRGTGTTSGHYQHTYEANLSDFLAR